MLFGNVAFMIRLRGFKDPYAYLISNGFTNREALKLLNKETEEVDLSQLGRLIKLLDCTANDLFDWNGVTDHPMAVLRKPTMDELERMLESFSPEEVLQIVRRK